MMGKLFSNELLFKDFGKFASFFYCSVKDCDSNYGSEELMGLDAEEKVIWGKFREASKRLLPMCSIHGSFLLYADTKEQQTSFSSLM